MPQALPKPRYPSGQRVLEGPEATEVTDAGIEQSSPPELAPCEGKLVTRVDARWALGTRPERKAGGKLVKIFKIGLSISESAPSKSLELVRKEAKS